MKRLRTGVALLESLVALTVLGVMGSALAMLTIESSRAATHATAAEVEIQRASRFLDAVAVWPREDLDRRLGTRRQGDWQLTVIRPRGSLYEIQLHDSTGSRLLLATALYRPTDADPSHAR